MYYLEWVVLLLTVGLLVSFFTAGSDISRCRIFLTLCAIGAGAGAYGWIKFCESHHYKPHLYFQATGLPLSVTIAIVLCFAGLNLENTFTDLQLKDSIYPLLCWFFAGWASVNFGASIWYNVVKQLGIHIAYTPWGIITAPTSGTLGLIPVWEVAFDVTIIAAFVAAALSRLKLRLFQIFLPVLFLLFIVEAWTDVQSTLAGFVPPELGHIDLEAWRSNPVEAFRNLFLGFYIWGLFILFGYLYLNTKANREKLYQYRFVEKLPNAATLLVTASFLYQFPEYNQLRESFPNGLLLFEYVTITLDILLIPAFLISYWWPYGGRSYT